MASAGFSSSALIIFAMTRFVTTTCPRRTPQTAPAASCNGETLDFKIAACYLLDSQFVADVAKFISGVLCCLSAMTSLELPHVNVLSKCDLLPSKHALETFLEAVSPR